MITNKIFQIGVDVHKIDLYSNPEKNLMNVLMDRFEGYCYKSCFIHKILRIIKRSECVIDQNDLDAFGKVSIQFEAEVEIILKGDIINGCKVERKNAYGITICTRDNLVIGFTPHPMFNSVAEGQLMSIRVIGCKYQIGHPQITANGTPFMYAQGEVFKITEAMDDNDVKYLQAANAKVATEKVLFDGMNAALRTTFSALLCAYKTQPKMPRGASKIDINDTTALKKIKDAYIVRDYREDLTKPVAYVYKNAEDVAAAYPDARIESLLPTRGVVLNVIHEYANYMKMVREMADIYNTPDAFLKHKNMWKIFKKLKLE